MNSSGMMIVAVFTLAACAVRCAARDRHAGRCGVRRVPAFVSGVCGECHAVTLDTISPDPQAPGFADIALARASPRNSRDLPVGRAQLSDAMDVDLVEEDIELIADYLMTLQSEEYSKPLDEVRSDRSVAANSTIRPSLRNTQSNWSRSLLRTSIARVPARDHGWDGQHRLCGCGHSAMLHGHRRAPRPVRNRHRHRRHSDHRHSGRREFSRAGRHYRRIPHSLRERVFRPWREVRGFAFGFSVWFDLPRPPDEGMTELRVH